MIELQIGVSVNFDGLTIEQMDEQIDGCKVMIDTAIRQTGCYLMQLCHALADEEESRIEKLVNFCHTGE